MDILRRLHQVLLGQVSSQLSVRQMAWLQQTEISYNPSLRTTLGRAFFRQNRIELNPTLLEQYPHELESTFAHELAHLVAPLLHGRMGQGHQIGWRRIMTLWGYEAKTTHRLPVQDLRRTHRIAAFATCGCENFKHAIKPQRYRKMLFGRRRYACLRCQQELRLERPSSKIVPLEDRKISKRTF